MSVGTQTDDTQTHAQDLHLDNAKDYNLLLLIAT